MSVATGGVVLNPPSFYRRNRATRFLRGVAAGKNLMLSDRAHVIFPWHMAEDRAMDGSVSKGEAIGSTLARHRSVLSRQGRPRAGDPPWRSLFADFRQKIEHIATIKNQLLKVIAPELEPLDAAKIHEEYVGYAAKLKPYVADTTSYLLDAVEAGSAFCSKVLKVRCSMLITERSHMSQVAIARD